MHKLINNKVDPGTSSSQEPIQDIVRDIVRAILTWYGAVTLLMQYKETLVHLEALRDQGHIHLITLIKVVLVNNSSMMHQCIKPIEYRLPARCIHAS